jgi:hypothetical protein
VFRLGFGDRTLGYRLPNSQLVEGKRIRSRLQALGVLRSTGHEHFRGSLVMPVLEETGQVGEVYGRKIRDDLRSGTPKHLYLPGTHRGVFNIAASETIHDTTGTTTPQPSTSRSTLTSALSLLSSASGILATANSCQERYFARYHRPSSLCIVNDTRRRHLWSPRQQPRRHRCMAQEASP